MKLMNTARRALVAAALPALLLSACEGPTVPPAALTDMYAYHLETDPPSILRWPSGTTVRVYLAGGEGERAAGMRAAFEHGAARWNAAARYAEYRLVEVADVADADVVIRWAEDIAPVEMSGCPPVVSRAVTTFCLNETDATRLHVFPLADGSGPGSVRMVVSILGSQLQTPDRVTRLVTHELGHVLGIAQHSPVASDLMYGGEISRSDLSVRDRSTVGVLYHTRAGVTP